MKFLQIYLFIIFYFPLSAQRLVPVVVRQDTLNLRVTAIQGKPGLEWSLKEDVRASKEKQFCTVTGARFEDAALVIDYVLQEPEKGFSYRTRLALKGPDGEEVTPPSRLAGGDYGQLPSGIYGLRHLRWMDAAENLLDYGQSYRLVLTSELWGSVNCADKRPQFTLKEQWPHYAIAGIGLAVTGIGQLYRQQKQENYDIYLDLRNNRRPRSEADPYLAKAEDKERLTKGFTYAGWAVLGLDAAVFIFRALDTKARQRRFDRYCAQPELSWRAGPGGAAVALRF